MHTIEITAADPSDYAGLFECQTIQPGTTTFTFTVTVKGDKKKEPDETFALLLLAPFVNLADPVATGTILNDD